MRIFKQRTVLFNIIRTALVTILASACLINASASEAQVNAAVEETMINSEGHRYRPGELLVKFRPNVAQHHAEMVSGFHGAVEVKGFRRPRHLPSSPMDQWRLIKLGAGINTEEVLERFAADPDVERVELNYAYTTNLFPNDKRFSQQWALHNTGQTGGTPDADIDAPETWDIQTGSSDVVVAVIDSGVDYTHNDLTDNIWVNPGEIAGNGLDDDGNDFIDDVHGWDFANDDNDPFDDRGHGTRVTGVIAAKGNNDIGIAGVSWNVSIMALKFINAKGTGYTSDAIEAVLYSADMGAHVMNNSWGGGSFSNALLDAITTANDAGALFVASAGNSSEDNDDDPHYPSSYEVPNVIAVAATDNKDNLSSSSNYGLSSVDLGAPGVTIVTTNPNNKYRTSSGTSIATPHVTGAAALVMAQYPALSHLEVKEQLLSTVDPVATLAGITVTGGRLNVFNALGGTPPVNEPPVANPNGPYTGVEDIAVVFDGSGSSDPNGDPLTFAWDFGDGGTDSGVSPSHIYTEEGTYTIILIVNDGLVDSEPAYTTATISPVGANQTPVADAGLDQTVQMGSLVLLDATASTDPDGSIVSYAWQQIVGSPPVTLDNAGSAVASFIAPNVGAKPKAWVFEVTVTDNNGATATDQVTITVTR